MVAPGAALAVPAAHGVHVDVDVPEARKVPGEHGIVGTEPGDAVHMAAPMGLVEPATHELHAVWPMTAANVFTAQNAHVVRPSPPANVPTAQLEHADKPTMDE